MWIFSGLLVLVGVAQAWLLYRTWGQIERQAGIMQGQLKTMGDQVAEMQSAGKQTDQLIGTMRDTAIRELRAYVCLSSAVIEFRLERAPEIRIYIKNYGKTPAYDVRWWTETWIAEYPPKQPLPKPPPNFVTAISVLAPGGKPHTMVTRQNPPIPEHLMPKLGTRELTLYAYGKVTYRDAFGNERYTEYRLRHGGLEPIHMRDKNGIKVGLLKTDLEGNEAT